MRRRTVGCVVAGLLGGLLATVSTAGAAAPTTVFISEFMASNTATLADEDGAFSDWIEITNGGASSVDLAGYQLTDDASTPAKWLFPSITLSAGQRMIVFASSKNKHNTPANPHTNFALGAGGEYLGLRNATGTVMNEFAPGFPAQTANVSYGLNAAGDTAFLQHSHARCSKRCGR